MRKASELMGGDEAILRLLHKLDAGLIFVSTFSFMS